MLVKVLQCYEDGGRALARHRFGFIKPDIEGNLTLMEHYETDLRRTVRIARLVSVSDAPIDVLPPLRDAVVLYVNDGMMTISGFETDFLTRKSTAQSWLIECGKAADRSTR